MSKIWRRETTRKRALVYSTAEGEGENGNEGIILINKHYIKVLFRFLSTNHSVPPGIIVKITSKYIHVHMSSSLVCSYVLEWKEEINRIFLNGFYKEIYLTHHLLNATYFISQITRSRNMIYRTASCVQNNGEHFRHILWTFIYI